MMEYTLDGDTRHEMNISNALAIEYEYIAVSLCSI